MCLKATCRFCSLLKNKSLNSSIDWSMFVGMFRRDVLCLSELHHSPKMDSILCLCKFTMTSYSPNYLHSTSRTFFTLLKPVTGMANYLDIAHLANEPS